jgi:hypothetical protein
VDPLVLLANSIIEVGGGCAPLVSPSFAGSFALSSASSTCCHDQQNGGKLPANAVASPSTQLPAETLSAANVVGAGAGWGHAVVQMLSGLKNTRLSSEMIDLTLTHARYTSTEVLS